jgi:histidyl-tRNA synthetase
VTSFSTPRGTRDILPDEWPYWKFVIDHAEEVAQLYDYRRIETPTFAETILFSRTSGAETDVGKEMYTFTDTGGDSLTLRAEGTAPVMRAYLQHGMSRWPQPVKLYYIERVYRREAPQQGRLREHHQFGCEAIGVEDAYVDVEMIALLNQFYRRIGLDDLSLHLNSIGDQSCRPRYVRDLVAFLRQHEGNLAQKDRERIERNPLRVLDSKETSSQSVLHDAPKILDYLCCECRPHWDKVLHGLDLLGIRYEIDPHLVRGLDYYTRTVFEFLPAKEGAQAVVGGGGRYDALSEAMGGPRVPGVGFGSGIERLVLNLRERNVPVPQPAPPVAFVAHIGPEAERAALELATALRRAGIEADMAFGNLSPKAQMRHAGRSGARYAAIIGETELEGGTVTLRDMESGQQERVPRADVAGRLRASQWWRA